MSFPFRLLTTALLLGGCAGLSDYSQGPVQPQSVAGNCHVERFFLLGLRSVPTTMTLPPDSGPCSFVLINPALNIPINAAFVTGAASHGQAQAGLISGARQAQVTYRAAPGYVGEDKFDVTLQPNAVGITVHVVVKSGS